jgi:hypothetical protein
MVTDSLTRRISNIERELEAVKNKISNDRDQFNSAAGSWRDIDPEEFKERVKEQINRFKTEKVEI